MINLLSALMKKVDHMQEQIGNISRDMQTLRRNPKEILEIKNSTTEMKNDSYGLVSRLNMAKDIVSELEDRSVETC